jgi:hypothetical protein
MTNTVSRHLAQENSVMTTTTVVSDARTQYWEEQIQSWKASGQSQQAFCRANDLNYARFGYWLRKLRRMSAEADRRPCGFVPVVSPLPGSSLSLVLPNGLELHGIAADNLPLVKQLVGYLS